MSSPLRNAPKHDLVKDCRPRRSTSYVSVVWPASPPRFPLHGQAYHVAAFHQNAPARFAGWRRSRELRLAAFWATSGLYEPEERTTAPERISTVRQAAQLRGPRLLSGRRVSSRGGGAQARTPSAQQAATIGAASADRYLCSDNHFVPRGFTLRWRSSPRGHGLGATCCRSRSLPGANRARNPEQPRFVKKGSAAASVDVRHADREQGDRSVRAITECLRYGEHA
jgi:hypothetical protein